MIGLKGPLAILLILPLLSSCGNKSLKDYGALEKDMKSLAKIVKTLESHDLSSEEILEGLDSAALIIDRLQEGRDSMSEESDRLTKESFELNSRRIETLKEGRLTLYESMDDFLVCSYGISDLIKKNLYYHERDELSRRLSGVQRRIVSMVQRDAPHSAKSSFSYYKNISSITSQTADEEGNWYYTIKVNIGYNYNEKDTQTLLNSSKVALGGIIRSYFSSLTKEESLAMDEYDLKAGLVMALNDYLLNFSYFKDKKMEGVKLVTFDMMQYYEFK